ncbi:hypothetical protein GC176_07700 [bacterium]|nr:hypothetical protein [bacterium]
MTRSSGFASTVSPVLTLILGILIGWRLGPEPAFRSGSDNPPGRVTLTGSNGGLSEPDPATGDPAMISSLPAGTPHSAAADAEVIDGADALQFFPEAIADKPRSLSTDDSRPKTAVIADSASLQPDQKFDEDVWRAELSGLTAEQADELIAIRKRLGKLPARTPGDTAEPFPALPGPLSASSAASAEPGHLPFLTDAEMRPAIALTGSEQTESPAVQRSSRLESNTVGSTHVSSQHPTASPSEERDDVDNQPGTASTITRFRGAVEDVYQLNIRNQKTPGYRRSEIVIVGASQTSESRIASAGAGPDGSETVSGGDTGSTSAAISWLTRIDLHPGETALTGNLYDVAIDGDGWFAVEHNGRRLFTRAGLLCQTDNGRLGLRTPLGHLPLVPEIRIDTSPGRLLIAENGVVNIAAVSGDGKNERREVGRIIPVCFSNESALQRTGSGLLTETTESGLAFPEVTARLKQGYLEQSSVNASVEEATVEELIRFAELLD